MPLLLLFLLAWAPPALDAAPEVSELFVHPLIAFPDKAFVTGSKDESRMDEWFVTTDEFEKALVSLQARGFMLVRASDVYGADGSVKAPVLPPGRKALLLSVDDLNYYPYMKANGTVSRLWVDKGHLLSRTLLPGGKFRDDDDNEVPLVLERFVAAHPDFSYNGARGLIAVTGFSGLFGWPTQWAGPKLAEAKTQARAVADFLKQMGWEFASHSYAHRTDKRQSFDDWKASEVRWDNEIRPLIGPTPYYVFPYGERWWADDKRWALLRKKGYRVFFGVETTSTVAFKDELPILGRVPMDGRGLRHRYGMLSPFLDTAQVLSPSRPITMKY